MKTKLSQTIEAKNKTMVLEAFDTLFNRRDYAAAEHYWSPDYIQHSAHIPPGRDGLFNLVKSLPPTSRHEPGTIVAEGDFVVLHSRYSGTGLPLNWIAADIIHIKDGVFIEHWDVIQDEATRESSKSGLPMFADTFPTERLTRKQEAKTDVNENSVAVISKEEVQAFYEEFLEVLKTGEITELERIYADDYLLVRPNGDTFSRKEILADLRQHSMKFTSFEVKDVLIRTKGSVGILTAVVQSTAVRDGVEITTHAKQLAIVSKENDKITISHFQSTNLVDSK